MRNFQLPGRSPVLCANGLAATSHPMATTTAVSILRDGGNAVDAAIAAAATLAVVEPQSTSIGGDCFAIIVEPDGSMHGLNGSGRSPAAATLSHFLDAGIGAIDPISAHSVTVPGAIAAWQKMHERFGAMDFARLFADAVNHARDGFAVTPRVAYDWGLNVGKLSADPGASKHYLIDGRAPVTGERMYLPKLGDTLATIALEGRDGFYLGPIADEIAATVSALGGLLTVEDLAAAEADWVAPISTRYAGHDIFEIPPNGQGLTALVLLNLLDALGMAGEPGSVEQLHLAVEAGRIAYGVRDAFIGDPNHMTVSIDDILSRAYTEKLASNYDPDRRNDAVRVPKACAGDTVYLSVIDRDLRAVSFINSTFKSFGSGIVTSNSCINLHCRGSGFIIEPGHPNAIGPSKRPLHTIIPAMAMKDGKVAWSFGVMGADYQPMGHAHVVANMLGFGMDPQQALDCPRIFWNEEGLLQAEEGIDHSAVVGLKARGHRFSDSTPHGGGQIVGIDHRHGVLIGGSDPRKDGHAGGY